MLDLVFWILVFAVALFVLVKSSDYFIKSAERIGVFLGLPAFIIGLIIVSLGTSLPELVSSIFSVVKGASEIVVANVVGSNIANIFLVLGVSAIYARKMKIDYNILNNDLPLFAATGFLLAAMIVNGRFTIFEAILCIFVIVFYVYTNIKMSKGTVDGEIKKEFKDVQKTKITIFKEILIFILTIIFIYFSAKYVIDSLINISVITNIATDIMAVTAVAFGTSLPELVVSVQAARQGKPEIAIGNVLGSNIFNSMGVMGISALFGTLIIPSTILTFALPMMLIATLLYFFIVQDRVVTYIEGVALVMFYLLFIGFFIGIV